MLEEVINCRLDRTQVFATVRREQAVAHQAADLGIGDLDYETTKAGPPARSATTHSLCSGFSCGFGLDCCTVRRLINHAKILGDDYCNPLYQIALVVARFMALPTFCSSRQAGQRLSGITAALLSGARQLPFVIRLNPTKLSYDSPRSCIEEGIRRSIDLDCRASARSKNSSPRHPMAGPYTAGCSAKPQRPLIPTPATAPEMAPRVSSAETA
jgi:hypothetical protein